MSMTEAIEDNISYDLNTISGRAVYYIPCEVCGGKVKRTQYSRKRNYICDYCKGLLKKKEKIVISKEIISAQTKAEKRFEKAVEEIKHQVKNIDEYKNEIKIAKTKTELYGSIPEAMVAIELLKLKYKIIPQQKVGKYRVDFALPKEKIIIEVDGKIFHNGTSGNREAEIQLMIGLDWKIIHIPAESIRGNITKLKNAIGIFYKQ